jgi:hypothetical protein
MSKGPYRYHSPHFKLQAAGRSAAGQSDTGAMKWRPRVVISFPGPALSIGLF